MERKTALAARWGWVLVSWIVFSVLVTGLVMYGMWDHGHSFLRLLAWFLGAFLYWAAMTPLVLRLTQSVRLDSRARLGWLVHLAAGILLTAVHITLLSYLALRIDPYDAMDSFTSFKSQFQFLLTSWVHLDLMIYTAIAGVAYALRYRERHHRRQVRETRLREELAEARLRALELELQPHFLFNTLNGAVTLVRAGSNREAEEMLVGLSELLRATLGNRGRQEIALSQELQIAERYLEIQKARFHDRLTVRLDVAPETADAAVPSLILQPLLENAIRHGVARSAAGGTVAVDVARDADRLRIRVVDDGPGLPQARPPDASSADDTNGIGLENTRSRLETLYGSAWDLSLKDLSLKDLSLKDVSLENGPGRGVAVTLSIPWRRLHEGDQEPARA